VGGEWSTPRSGRLTPRRDTVSVTREAGWAPRPVWKGAENLASTGIRSPDRPAPFWVGIPTDVSQLTNMECHIEYYEHCFWRNVTGSGCDVDSFVVPEFTSVKCEDFEELFWGLRIIWMRFEPCSFRFKIKCCVTEPSLEIQAIQLMCAFIVGLVLKKFQTKRRSN